MSNVLIAGLGDVGQQLMNELIAANHQVWGIKRQVLPEIKKKTGCHLILADLVKSTTLISLPQDIDYVVYCPSPDSRSEESYRQIFIQGLLNVCAALNINTIKRFFYISSTGVYGQNQGEWVNELSEAEPEKYSGKVLLEAEALLHQQPMNTTVIRFAGIYGPGKNQMLRQLIQGNIKTQETDVYTNRIHRTDAVRMIHFLIEQDIKKEPVAQTYIGVDDKPCSKNEISIWLFQHLSKKFGDKSVKPLQYIKDNQGSVNKNKRCSNTKIKEEGFVFEFRDYESGYLNVLEQIGDIESIS